MVQALLFGVGHVYLGPRGVMNAAAIGLVMGGVYWANGRNLCPLIIAHGLVDGVSLTVLRLGLAHQGQVRGSRSHLSDPWRRSRFSGGVRRLLVPD